MVLCFIALGVFSVLGIFSAKYRAYAREAFHCVLLKATLRKCDSDLDLKIRAEIVGRLMGKSPLLARFTNVHFELLSWVFTLLMFASLAYSIFSVYNYVAYGNCNGPESTEACFLDPSATGEHGFSRHGDAGTLRSPPSVDGHAQGDLSAEIVVVEYGCYACPYTKNVESVVQQLLDSNRGRIRFLFKPMPIDRHPYAWEAALAAECADEQGKFWEYKDALFENQHAFRTNGVPVLQQLAQDLSLNAGQFNSCLDSKKYLEKVNASHREGMSIGIYGTPTFFVNNRSFVGHVSYGELAAAVQEAMNE